MKKTLSLSAFTLVETVVSMALISVIFVLVMQAFNSLILGSYLVDSRTAVRNEGEFVSEYLKLRIKNADPKSLKVNAAHNELTWQTRGASDVYTLFSQVNPSHADNNRICIDTQGHLTGTTCDTVLTYEDVNIKDLKIAALTYTDNATGQQFTTVDISFMIDSTAKLGNRAAVVDVSRFITIAIR